MIHADIKEFRKEKISSSCFYEGEMIFDRLYVFMIYYFQGLLPNNTILTADNINDQLSVVTNMSHL